MKQKYRLLIGLGNPPTYSQTRHNVGQQFLDHLDQPFEYNKSLLGSVAKYNEMYLFKPHSYMNLCGKSVKGAMTNFDIKMTDICILHDDLDTVLGKGKIKHGGSASGHNGLLSVISSLKTNEFDRLKIGIGRPNEQRDVPEYVLQPFTQNERKILIESFAKLKELLGLI